MAHVRLTTFLDKTVSQFKIYAASLVSEHADMANRSNVFAYLSKIVADDEKLIGTLEQKRYRLRKAKKYIESLLQTHLDFSQSVIFQASTQTEAQIAALLQNDDAVVYVDGKSLPALQFDGSNITLDGQATGDARSGTLTCSSTCGAVQVQGSNITIRGVRIAPGSGEKTFKMSAACSNLVIEDCIFDGTGTDGIWFCGNDFLSGNVTIRNCLIQNYTGHWMFGDLSTNSNAPVTKLDSVLIEKNKFENIEASFAIRGKLDEPTDECIFVDNEFEYSAAHAYFWSSIEINNCAFVQVLRNKVTAGPGRVAGKAHGFLQTWNKSTNLRGNWTLNFDENEIDGYDFGIQIACSPGFFAPNAFDPDYLIQSQTGDFGDTTYGMTWMYESGNANRWFEGVWTPENLSDYASPPSSAFADKPVIAS